MDIWKIFRKISVYILWCKKLSNVKYLVSVKLGSYESIHWIIIWLYFWYETKDIVVLIKALSVWKLLQTFIGLKLELKTLQEVPNDRVVLQKTALLLDVLVLHLVRLLNLFKTSSFVANIGSAYFGTTWAHDGALVEPLVLLEADW